MVPGPYLPLMRCARVRGVQDSSARYPVSTWLGCRSAMKERYKVGGIDGRRWARRSAPAASVLATPGRICLSVSHRDRQIGDVPGLRAAGDGDHLLAVAVPEDPVGG